MMRQFFALTGRNPQYAAAYAAIVHASAYFKEIRFADKVQEKELALNYNRVGSRIRWDMIGDVARMVDSYLADSDLEKYRCDARIQWCDDDSLELSLSAGFQEYVFAFPKPKGHGLPIW